MHNEVEINIPLKPISVNIAWQGKQFKSKMYKQYEKELAYLLRAPRERGFGTPDHMAVWIRFKFDEKYIEKVKVRIDGFVEIHYLFYLKNWKATDADNLVKVTQDLIVKHGYIEDDRKIMRYLIEKIPAETNRIEVKIRKFKK